MMEAVNDVAMLDDHLVRLIVLSCLLIVELAVRLAPSKVDRSLVNLLARMVTTLLDYTVPNRTPNGRYITKIESNEQKNIGNE